MATEISLSLIRLAIHTNKPHSDLRPPNPSNPHTWTVQEPASHSRQERQKNELETSLSTMQATP